MCHNILLKYISFKVIVSLHYFYFVLLYTLYSLVWNLKTLDYLFTTCVVVMESKEIKVMLMVLLFKGIQLNIFIVKIIIFLIYVIYIIKLFHE